MFTSQVSERQYAPTSQTSSPATRPYVVGEENKFLTLLSYEILNDIHPPLPVYLYAPVGSGKSHFVEGLFATWKRLHPGMSAELVSVRDFSSRLVDAVRTQTMQEFYRVFYRLDFLVLEDFHLIGTMPFAQQELSRVLDKLRQRQGRVLITSSSAVGHLSIHRKLASRLNEGLSVRIYPPLAETRRAILLLPEIQKTAQLSEETLESLVEYCDQASLTVYEMISALGLLEMKRRNEKRRKITPADVRAHYQQVVEENTPAISDIAKVVARYYKVKLLDLRSKSRRATFVLARDVAYYLTRKFTPFTLAEIGDYFAGRDHATILHGLKNIEAELKTNPELRHAVEHLGEVLRPVGEMPVFSKSVRGKK